MERGQLLESLGVRSNDGAFFRFDDHLDDARVAGLERPERGDPGEPLSFEYDDGDTRQRRARVTR